MYRKKNLMNFSQKLQYFNFLIIVNSVLSQKIYIALFLIDIAITLMLPIDKILQFSPFMKEGNFDANLNVFLNFFAKLQSFDVLTDILNCTLLLFLILLAIVLFKIQTFLNGDEQLKGKQTQNNKYENKLIQVLSLILLIVGRFLSPICLGIQILAMRCYSSSHRCQSHIGIERFISNLIGIFIILLIMYIQYKFQAQNLPDPQAPYSMTKTRYNVIIRLTFIVQIIILVFENTLLKLVSFYVLSLPLLAASSIALYVITTKIVYFSQIVDTASLFKIVIMWNFSFYACAIDILTSQSDFILTILIAFSTSFMGIGLCLYKHQNSYNLMDAKNITNSSQAQQTILKIYNMILRHDKDSLSYQGLEKAYKIHKIQCQNQGCLCKSDLKSKVEEQNQISELYKQKFGKLQKYRERKSERINYNLLKIYFQKFEQITEQTKLLIFLEIYIKIITQNDIHQSMYQLVLLQNSIKEQDEITYIFLKNLINERALKIEQEQKSNKEYVAIDYVLITDEIFQEYKKSVYDTALEIEKFWQSLSQKDYLLQTIIDIGIQIVNFYLQTKQSFDFMIQNKPDFEEAVVIHLRFLDQVMNFELESSLLQNMLVNLRQKLQISRQSHYISDYEKQAFLIVQATATSPKILFVNDMFCKLTGHCKQDIQGQSLNCLIPSRIAQVHDQLISEFLLNPNHSQFKDSINKRVWINKYDYSILPGDLQISLKISADNDLVFQCNLKTHLEIQTSSINFNLSQAFVIITDDIGIIYHASENFIEKFIQEEEFFSFEDSRIFIDDVIPNIQLYNQDELTEGKTTNMHSYVSSSSQKPQQEDIRLLPIVLQMKQYKFPNNQIVKEYIIVPQFDFQNYKKKKIIIGSDNDNEQNDENSEEFISQDKFEQLMQDINASISASASNSSTSESLRQKQEIDEKSIPKSLQNLQKAIIIFFLILIGTSFAVLSVNQIQNIQFKEDSTIVTHSITLSGNMNYLRLCFRMMISTSKITDGEILLDMQYLQDQMDKYFDRLQQDSKIVLNEQNYQLQELKDVMLNENIRIQELQDDTNISIKNYTFAIAIQQYMAKAQKFITINSDDFIQEFQSFRMRELLPNPPLNHKDAYYLVINGMYDLRSYALRMSDLYVKQSQSKGENYQYLVLVITMICISVTFIAAIGVIPITFSLDNESQHIVEQWMHVDIQTKKQTLKNVRNFLRIWNEEEAKKSGKKVVKSNLLTVKDLELLNEEIAYNALLPNKNKQSMFSYTNRQKISSPLQEVKSLFMDQHNVNVRGFNSLSFRGEQMSQMLKNQQTQYDINIPPYLTKTFQNIQNDSLNHNIVINDVQDQQMLQSKISQASVNLASETKQNKQEIHSKIYDSVQKYFIQNNNQYLDRSDILNDSTTHINNNQQEFNRDRYKDLYKIFRVQKCKKITLIMIFSIVICGFYLAFFFISQQISQFSRDSFTFIRNYSRRPTCLGNGFNFMIETFTQNQTIKIGFEEQPSFDFLQKQCMEYERIIANYQQSAPIQLKEIWNQINQINSDKMCDIVFESNQTLINECLKFNNGIFKKGLKNTMLTQYYYIIQEYVDYYTYDDKPWKKTDQFLTSHEFSEDTQNLIRMLIRFIIPSSRYLEDLVQSALNDYLDFLINIYIAIFVVFMLFLLTSLIICLRFVIKHLRTIVMRSKILIKIIPSEALKSIKKYIKDQKEQSVYSYKEKYNQQNRNKRLD